MLTSPKRGRNDPSFNAVEASDWFRLHLAGVTFASVEARSTPCVSKMMWRRRPHFIFGRPQKVANFWHRRPRKVRRIQTVMMCFGNDCRQISNCRALKARQVLNMMIQTSSCMPVIIMTISFINLIPRFYFEHPSLNREKRTLQPC
jgi:hypothetical protein